MIVSFFPPLVVLLFLLVLLSLLLVLVLILVLLLLLLLILLFPLSLCSPIWKISAFPKAIFPAQYGGTEQIDRELVSQVLL